MVGVAPWRLPVAVSWSTTSAKPSDATIDDLIRSFARTLPQLVRHAPTMSFPGLLSALALNSIRGACTTALLLAASAGYAADEPPSGGTFNAPGYPSRTAPVGTHGTVGQSAETGPASTSRDSAQP